MPARTRTAAVTLLAAAGAVLAPVTGAHAAESGHRDHPGGHRPEVRHERVHERVREAPLHGVTVRQRPQDHPAGAVAKDRSAKTARQQPSVTHGEHRGGVSRPAAPAGAAGAAGVAKHQAEHPGRHREAASNPVRRMVQAGQTVKGHRDVGGPLVAGAAALLAVGGGAYGVRLLGRRRAAGRAAG
ncbi:hypothetical protein I5Q34_18910 [Streptomyces sp. AV19]|uniref:hypothetical protein n=1 Tax=Streptomyces sp. AV19 TaxID=2793068 RepID=UPI0018FE4DAC|nr:hypothetical protein [Streptomyces sp. AV19]MBH1936321.1 hypothetical protein [Streptomyces sp. AV19]MDG4532358.1 hypothetical protein [Streptomyces sp. AV19]